jgi:META domain
VKPLLASMLAALVLSACSVDTREKGAAQADVPPNPVGQWQATTLNGKPFDPRQLPIQLSVGAGWMQARSQCVWWHWDWRVTAPAVFTAKTAPFLQRSEANSDAVPLPMCARGLALHEQAFAKAVDGARTIGMPDAARFTLTGPAGAIGFVRRSGIEGHWSVDAINATAITKADYPIQLVIDRDTIGASSQCVWWRWRYRLDAGRLTLTPIDTDIPICERTRTATEDGFERTMASVQRVMINDDHTLTFNGAKGPITASIAP